MSASALSVFVFGIYLIVAGAGFLFIPNSLLPIFKMPKTEEPWIRIMALLVILLGCYYVVAAQNELTVFFWSTVVGRFAILLGFALLVIAKKAKPVLITFGLVDAAGAIWTMLAS